MRTPPFAQHSHRPLLSMAGRRRRSDAAVSVSRGAMGAGAVGALALGALAVGAMAIGALAINRMMVRRARIEHLSVGTLEVDELILRNTRKPDDRPDTDDAA